ncbi:hypothetical protein HY029_05045, partial [Candidatus Gottesmanbacteria bacterium]|nr:hypothetical protein [Candidatus Gottesmanbacteria bacterium]
MIPAHSAHFHKYKNIFLPIILLFSFDLIVLTALLNRIANPASLSRFFPKAQSDGFSIKATVPSNIDLTGYSLYICRWKSEELKNAGDVPNGYECPQGQLVVSEQTEYSFENVVPGANNEVYVILKPNNSNDPKDNPIKATGNDCSTSESHPGHCLITLNDNNLNYQVNFIKITDQGTNLDESIIDISKGDLSKSQKDSTTENTSPDITPKPTIDPICSNPEAEDTSEWIEKCTEKMADKGVIDREKWGFGEEYIAPEIMPSTQL